jgi:hypothetical protein
MTGTRYSPVRVQMAAAQVGYKYHWADDQVEPRRMLSSRLHFSLHSHFRLLK